MKKFAVCYQASFQELKHEKHSIRLPPPCCIGCSAVLGYFTIEAESEELSSMVWTTKVCLLPLRSGGWSGLCES